MTEAEWDSCADPDAMIGSLPHATWTERRARLFCVYCGRRVSSHLADTKCGEVLDIAERYADALAEDGLLSEANDLITDIIEWEARNDANSLRSRTADVVLSAIQCPPEEYIASEGVAEIAERSIWPNLEVWNVNPDAIAGGRVESTHLAQLVRCIAGNPFRPVEVDPSWLTSTVVALASGVYDDRAFDRLPILADALMDAGCDNADVLSHCRSDGPHARGCWVVDLLLGKA
jgi:hypothetical protein